MRTLIFDADVPMPVVEAMVTLRLPTMSVKQIPGTAENDNRVIDVAHTLDAIVVTIDRDFTQQPLFAAMVEKGSRVVRLRPPKCPAEQTLEKLAILVLTYYREWQILLEPYPGVVSCNEKGNRLRLLKDFPWYQN